MLSAKNIAWQGHASCATWLNAASAMVRKQNLNRNRFSAGKSVAQQVIRHAGLRRARVGDV